MSQVLSDCRGHGSFQGCSADPNPGLDMAGAGPKQDKAHGHWLACGAKHLLQSDPDRGEYTRGCDTQRRGEDRGQIPEGCVRAESAIPIPAATDQHPTLVRLGKAFV